MRRIHYILLVVLLASAQVLCAARKSARQASQPQFKVLCIGNSFSIDAVEQNLVQLADERGIAMVVGNLYIGGCSLEQHATNIRKDSAAYSYRHMCKNASGEFERVVTEGVSIMQALLSDDWDVVTMQQASHYSGQWSTYEPFLSELLDSVRLHILPKTKIYWYMTWAYQQDARHPAFVPNYNGSQAYMYDEIVGCNRQVLKRHAFDGFIPGGVLVQQGRQTKLGDAFCRDGYHLSFTYGRYMMACLWLEVLTGKSARGCKYMAEGMRDEERKIVQRVAHRVAKQGEKSLRR